MSPSKALLTRMVEEACAHVQGESLKAQAVFLVRLINSPITRSEGDVNITHTIAIGLGAAVVIVGVIAWTWLPSGFFKQATTEADGACLTRVKDKDQRLLNTIPAGAAIGPKPNPSPQDTELAVAKWEYEGRVSSIKADNTYCADYSQCFPPAQRKKAFDTCFDLFSAPDSEDDK